MAELLGSVIGAWLFYMLVSLLFTHKGGVIFLIVYCVGTLFPLLSGLVNWGSWLGGVICIILVNVVPKLRVRDNSPQKK